MKLKKSLVLSLSLFICVGLVITLSAQSTPVKVTKAWIYQQITDLWAAIGGLPNYDQAIIDLETANADLLARVEVLEGGSGNPMTKLPPPDYDSGWLDVSSTQWVELFQSDLGDLDLTTSENWLIDLQGGVSFVRTSRGYGNYYLGTGDQFNFFYHIRVGDPDGDEDSIYIYADGNNVAKVRLCIWDWN